MPGFQHVYQTLIRESHLDTFGHVNNAQYLNLFEEARWEWITSRGYGLEVVKSLAQGPVILEAQVKFRKELKLREAIRIESAVMQYEGKIGRVRQAIWNQQEQLSAEAEFVMGFFDLKQRRLIPPTEQWLHAIGWEGV